MRVTVDGERRVEREVPAGQRLPFGADRVIVRRVGGRGGVHLAVSGKDQGLLGRDGQIAVRTLTKSRTAREVNSQRLWLADKGGGEAYRPTAPRPDARKNAPPARALRSPLRLGLFASRRSITWAAGWSV